MLSGPADPAFAADRYSVLSERSSGAPVVTQGSAFEAGLRVRREVLGDAYVDANLAGSDTFMMAFQHLVTELAWARAWGGGSLDRKTKSLVSL